MENNKTFLSQEDAEEMILRFWRDAWKTDSSGGKSFDQIKSEPFYKGVIEILKKTHK